MQAKKYSAHLEFFFHSSQHDFHAKPGFASVELGHQATENLDTGYTPAKFKPMTFLAPAKINLHLRVGAVRADGFHPLLTWMTTISLFDKLELENNSRAGQIEMTCTDPSIPCDDRNLVIKAAKAIGQTEDRSVTIHLDKKIPHGGGLGGGSSDAAFTLKALNDFWNLRKEEHHLNHLAAQLGSDIPFFLHGPSSVCTGRGEIVKPISEVKIARWVVLILPAITMPTPAVYRQFDQMKLGSDLTIEPDWKQWCLLSSQELMPLLTNDLEAPAFAIEPKLASLRESIEKQLHRPVRMSGSGSSLFTLYDDCDSAQAATGQLVSQPARVIVVGLQ